MELQAHNAIMPREAPPEYSFWKPFAWRWRAKMFELGLWKLGGFLLRDGAVLFLDGGAMLVFRHEGRVETRKGTRVE
jgi:hypothetical protein